MSYSIPYSVPEIPEGSFEGPTLSATTSLVPGSASVEASAFGVVQVLASSLLPGSASGLRVGNASGLVLGISATFVPGNAASMATAAGVVFSKPVSLLTGAATGAGVAAGQALQTGVSLASGSAEGGMAGMTFEVTISFIPGSAFEQSGFAPGKLISVSASIVGGTPAVFPTRAPRQKTIIIPSGKELIQVKG